MWKLIGMPVSSRGGPQPIPGRVADVDVEDADDRAAVTTRGRSARARRPRPRGSGRAGTRGRTSRSGATALNSSTAQSFHAAKHAVLQLRIVDREARARAARRSPRPTGRRGPCPRAAASVCRRGSRRRRSPRARSRCSCFCAALTPALPLRPMTRSSHTHTGLPSRVDHVRPHARRARAGRSRLPELGRHRGEIEVVVAGVDAGAGIHGATSPWRRCGRRRPRTSPSVSRRSSRRRPAARSR